MKRLIPSQTKHYVLLHMKLFYFINSLPCTTQQPLSTKTELGVLVFGKRQHPLLMLQHPGTTYKNDIGNRRPVVSCPSWGALINLSGKKPVSSTTPQAESWSYFSGSYNIRKLFRGFICKEPAQGAAL